jgi:fumarylacetoacetate (FAA) hydrolase family protein
MDSRKRDELVERFLPADRASATLVGRAWLPGARPGPSPVAVRGDGTVVDLSARVPTVSALLESADRVAIARGDAPVIGDVAALLSASLDGDGRAGAGPTSDAAQPRLLAPCDLQAVKASGVTFVSSLLERVIEEQARGDAGRADAIRARVTEILGGDLRAVRPGSEQAARIKAVLLEQGAWSQYLEVGIGPDAEIFTKCPPMAAVGFGARVGLHPASTWNNPEPEVVLAVSAAGEVVGATLGNDVNLRDFEGRSALLLGKAKDNNASCAIGPFIRLFDEHFGIDQVRGAELALTVRGRDGYRLDGRSSMREISRDPLELVGHAWGPHHQYPDGFMLFMGTMFAPTQDRGARGMGFTHAIGDEVEIRCDSLGALLNTVDRCDAIPRWEFGIGALMDNLAKRGLLAR